MRGPLWTRHANWRAVTHPVHGRARDGGGSGNGYAVQAHGFLTRPSEDVDLFTSAERTDFRDGVTTIKSAYEKNGFTVRIDVCSEHFARLWATDTHSGESGKVELAADIRSKAPVAMSIGPVVHVDDVAGLRGPAGRGTSVRW